ncbi:MAG: MATE family efflux transporter [Lachnospiraceae bacterium]|nr:MATE family efflux transporter [Lachnospiraceae bacterium]
MSNDLTTGNIRNNLIKFALPYLLAAFLQTFYGMADLMIVGMYNTASTTTAVSIGSQVMHMLTVIILGFAMGTTVHVGQCIGAKDREGAGKIVANSVCFFAVFAVVVTIALLVATGNIVKVMSTPIEAVTETEQYLYICFAGLPFIVAYNVISSVYRGAGDSKSPLYFVAIACTVNIILDFWFIGYCGMGAKGAALGTVIGQAVSVVISLVKSKKADLGFSFSMKGYKPDKEAITKVLSVGTPIAVQDGFIQIGFIVITIIANSRGLIDAAAVGIVEKIICFMFLVPSAFLSAISVVTAQNIGAGKKDRAKKSLYYGLLIAVSWGLFCAIYNQFLPHTLVARFTRETPVLIAGCEYLRSYSFDTVFAAVHFCFSGYFCGCEKSKISFIHNLMSVLLVRIPGTYMFSKMWPDTLYPMGWGAPLGSLLSAIICVGVFIYFEKKEKVIADNN